MMMTKIFSAGLLGIDAYLIDVEIDIKLQSLPTWSLVGLADSEVRESKDRVTAAIKNAGYDFIFRKVTINLAPADTKKEGTAFDLPIALGLMVASENLISQKDLRECLFVGELGLNGEIRPVKGALSIAMLAQAKGFKTLIVPEKNAREAAIFKEMAVYGFSCLADVVHFLTAQKEYQPTVMTDLTQEMNEDIYDVDFSDIRGQYQSKRAIEIAASGGHNILLSGPPGSGKTMLASCIPSILPPLTFEESLETSRVYSVMGFLKEKNQLLTKRPFRSPHHSVSNSGLIGGGSYPKPGEVSLAHNGVLFLDELTEFKKHVLELLRQPLESHEVTIARAQVSLTYPARLILVASCNPCPCGYLSHPKVVCQCTTNQLQSYRQRLSGPLLDRIDLQIEVPPVSFDEMKTPQHNNENSLTVAKRVREVRQLQQNRFKNEKIFLNSQMTARHIERFCKLDQSSEKILKASVEKFHLSARALHRILKVARTIADMEKQENILMDHILEGIQYRNFDKKTA